MTTESKPGISRRDIIKKSAVAGAVFWSVPIIESITSSAAAVSGTTGGSFCGASYAFVFYKNISTGTYFFASFIKGTTTCGLQGTNHCDYTATGLGDLVGVDGTTIISFPSSNGSVSATVNGTTLLTTQNCVGVMQSGDTISALSGYEIVAVSAFGTSVHCHSTNTGDGITLTGSGTNGSGSGNSVTISFESCV